ncbi:MAG: DNA primase [Gammaproteobacteria bacterium]
MAGRIPQQFIDELMTRIDIVEVIDTRVPLRKAGREYTACCPFHDEKSPSFTVSQQKQFYHCFGCGAHGTALGFLMEYEHLDFVEAVHELAGQAGVQVPVQAVSKDSAPQGSKDLYGLLEQAADFYCRQLRDSKHAQPAVDYLKNRGLSGEIAAHYAIGYAPPGWDNLLQALGAGNNSTLQTQLAKAGLLIEKDGGGYYDRFRDRIMFPIRDQRGRVIGFGGRVLGDDAQGRAIAKGSASVAGDTTPGMEEVESRREQRARVSGATAPKYMNSPETPLFHKGRELYGLYEARKALRTIDRLLVVEGYMDVAALAQHGIQYAVATLGTATTRDHAERLFRITPTLVFCFDGDRAGREAAWRAVENVVPVMHEGRQANFLFLPDGEDPDSLVRKEGGTTFEARIAQASPFSSFFYDNLIKQINISTIDGRARLVELARPLLSNLPEDVFQHMMVARLAEIVRMETTQLMKILKQARPKSKLPLEKSSAKRAIKIKAPLQKSQVRIAIALLLQHPGLAMQAGDLTRFSGFHIPGMDLLVSLLQMLQTHPHLNSGALLERWRGTPESQHLMRLAQWQHLLPEENWEAEFCGALDGLYVQGIEQCKESLLDKSRNGELTAEDKHELQRLFALQTRMKPSQGTV